MLNMRVDGKGLNLESTKWSVYEATRKSKPVAIGVHSITVTSQLRMAWNDSALLWKITVENKKQENVTPDMIGYDDIMHLLEFSVQAQARQVRSWSCLLQPSPSFSTHPCVIPCTQPATLNFSSG